VKLALAADHAGFELKQSVGRMLAEAGHEIVDCGCHGIEQVDYLDPTLALVEQMVSGACERGICLCGNGYAMAMLANRFPGIRAAVCHDSFSARTVVEMGAANVLSIGARVVGEELALELVEIWLASRFRSDVERYARRLERLEALETELVVREWRAVLARQARRGRRPGESYRRRPQTQGEVGWADEATRRMIADEPW
jgi:ribose 5-phosphate isomerase B